MKPTGMDGDLQNSDSRPWMPKISISINRSGYFERGLRACGPADPLMDGQINYKQTSSSVIADEFFDSVKRKSRIFRISDKKHKFVEL